MICASNCYPRFTRGTITRLSWSTALSEENGENCYTNYFAGNGPDTYILLDVLVRSIAVYFFEWYCILTSPYRVFQITNNE